MNERIEALIRKMDGAVTPYSCNAMTVTDNDLAYFANLIVTETMQIILNEGKRIASETPKVDFNNYVDVAQSTGKVMAACEYADKIKQHFGVE